MLLICSEMNKLRAFGVLSVWLNTVNRNWQGLQRSVAIAQICRGKQFRLELGYRFGWNLCADSAVRDIKNRNVYNADEHCQAHESLKAATDNFEKKMLKMQINSDAGKKTKYCQ